MVNVNIWRRALPPRQSSDIEEFLQEADSTAPVELCLADDRIAVNPEFSKNPDVVGKLILTVRGIAYDNRRIEYSEQAGIYEERFGNKNERIASMKAARARASEFAAYIRSASPQMTLNTYLQENGKRAPAPF